MPGPGAYETVLAIGKEAQKYTMKGRTPAPDGKSGKERESIVFVSNNDNLLFYTLYCNIDIIRIVKK